MKYSLAVVVAALGFVACLDNDDYQIATVSGTQVYFSNALEDSYEISQEATSFSVPILRIDTADAATVPLTVTMNSGSIFSIANSVSFAAGSNEAQLQVSYDPSKIEYGKYDTITIAIDPEYVTPYGATSYTFTAGLTDWGPWGKWNEAGTATYTYANYWSGYDPGLPFVYRHNTIRTNLYQFKLSNWGSGVDIVFDYDKSTGFVTCAPQYAATHSTYGQVLVADSYYYWYNVRGTDISKMSDDDYGRFDEENGIITIPLAWYVSAGTFGYNVETITIDGYVRADLTAMVDYAGKFIDARDNYSLVADVALGADVEKANLALVAGNPTEDDIAAIANGTYEPLKELTESGRVYFDANELEDGDYTFVLVPFFEGEALEAQTVSFSYATAGKEIWNLVGTGDYTYTIFFADEDEEGNVIPVKDPDLEIYQSQDDPTRFKITHWGYDTDFIFTWNSVSGQVNVPQNFSGYTDPSYGDVYVMEAADYNPERYASYSSEYNAENSTFSFRVAYFVEVGSFGAGYETLAVNWNGGDAARSWDAVQRKNPTIRAIQLNPFNRYQAMMAAKHMKTVNVNLHIVSNER
ncbi:MAG: hypothetical protein IJT98_11420 [Prevotella sp.]|nr:hypothetical protein [Prevotella sp.]